MSKRLRTLPIVLTTLALSMSATTAFAAKHVKPEQMTCEDFLVLDADVQPSVIYWLHGKSGEVDAIDVEDYRRPVDYVVTECYKEKHATVAEKLKHYFEYIKQHMKPPAEDKS